jgi:hypothetical protein
MDIRNPTNILQRESEALADALAKAKPSTVQRLELELSDARKNRAKAQKSFDTECARLLAETKNNNAPPTPLMRRLEGELSQQDAKVMSLRNEITVARAKWKSEFQRVVGPHLDAVVPALENALRGIEAAQQVFNIYDAYCSNNGLSDSLFGSRSMTIDRIAGDLRRLIKDRMRERS